MGAGANRQQALGSRVLCVSFFGSHRCTVMQIPRVACTPLPGAVPTSLLVWGPFWLPSFLYSVLAKANLESPNDRFLFRELLLGCTGVYRWPLKCKAGYGAGLRGGGSGETEALRENCFDGANGRRGE